MVSPALLEELRRVLEYPKIAKRIPPEEAGALVELLEREALSAPDPTDRPTIRVRDPGDEYLIALAISQGAALVSGDKHLTALAGQAPIYRPAEFLKRLEPDSPGS